MLPTVRQLLDSFGAGASCEEAVARALAAAKQTESVFLHLHESAVEAAAAADRMRREGKAVPALAGLPISLKDLFDVRGQCTFAGSKVLRDEVAAAEADAEVVANLRAAGVLFLGRVNMSEFAFSGMGMNPHYGTPLSVWQAAGARLPGGSSSGSAVSVARGIVAGSIGSDTAGSCRIPAAFNGIVGVKPTYGRLSLRGVYPLSPTSDAPGPLASDVDGCYLLDCAMAGDLRATKTPPRLQPRAAESLRLLLPESAVMDELDDAVGDAFAAAVARLQDAGASIIRAPLPALDGCVQMFLHRAVAVFESYQAHKHRLAERGDEYDPFVRRRMMRGAEFDADARAAAYREKAGLIADFHRQYEAAKADALLYPTVQCIAPTMAEAADAEAQPSVNMRCLRNTATVNFFDGCAISLPCNAAGAAPVGLMLACGNGEDAKMYEVAAAVEEVLTPP